MPVPNSMVRPNGTQIDPSDFEYDNEYIGTDPLKSQIGTGTELKAPEQGEDKELDNVNIPIDQFGANNNWDDLAPGGGNLPDTSIYMKGDYPIPGPGNDTMTGNVTTTVG